MATATETSLAANIIANFVAGISFVGLLGYLGHWVFSSMNKKMDKSACKEFRDLEKDTVDRIDRDLQQHKEVR